jgi:hydrogenase expression/formation protein HypC
MKIIEVNGEEGVLELDGVRRKADLSLVSPISIGEYVLLHAGFAISRVNEKEALQTINLFKEWEEIAK